MINKIKETLNQIFFSPEASGTWEKNTEQTIDELEAPLRECGPSHFSHGISPYGDIPPENRYTGYTGIPAPAYLKDDEWFGPAPVSEKGQDYMEKETEIKQQEEENRQYWTKEPENIHQVMYDLATKSGKTTTQLDPIGGSENFQGGSENVHR
jgi:hypothetical protein